jgi:hypothetical protein
MESRFYLASYGFSNDEKFLKHTQKAMVVCLKTKKVFFDTFYFANSFFASHIVLFFCLSFRN